VLDGSTLASHRLAADTPNPRLGENGRAPVPRFAQVRDNRKLRNVSHWDWPGKTDSRQLSTDVNACVGLPHYCQSYAAKISLSVAFFSAHAKDYRRLYVYFVE
jgi:hypothetical protein